MTYLNLNTPPAPELQQQLTLNRALVACLCAAWCDVCSAYKPKFEALANEYPALLFLWIDVEDQAELVGDFEVENFPTLLIQQHGVVTFYGTMQPETSQLKRMIEVHAHQTLEQLHATATEQQRLWQREANLLQRLQLTL